MVKKTVTPLRTTNTVTITDYTGNQWYYQEHTLYKRFNRSTVKCMLHESSALHTRDQS